MSCPPRGVRCPPPRRPFELDRLGAPDLVLAPADRPARDTVSVALAPTTQGWAFPGELPTLVFGPLPRGRSPAPPASLPPRPTGTLVPVGRPVELAQVVAAAARWGIPIG